MDEQTLRKILQEELDKSSKKTEKRLEQTITKRLEQTITREVQSLSELINDFASQLDEKKADKSQTLPLEVRVQNLERKIFPQ